MKIFLLISNNYFYNNYLTKNILQELNKLANIQIISNKELVNDKKKIVTNSIHENDLNKKIHYLIATISMYLNENKYKSFKYRIETRYSPQKIQKINIKSITKFLKKFTSHILFKIIASSEFISKNLILLLKNFLSTNNQLKQLILTQKPDLVLMPTNGYFSFELDMEYTLHQLNQKYISLVDNWDNLTTKTILTYKANHYGVWGGQNRIHAKEVQGIDINDTSSIGTPRYEVYKKKHLKRLFDFKYILFTGSSNQFDEYKILKKMNYILDNTKNIKLVYRPHPWRESNEFPNLSNLKNIVLDPQIENFYKNKKNDFSFNFTPDLDYYPDLVGGAEFVIGGPTSMMIEAQLIKKKYIVFAHEENNQKYSPKKWLNAYNHFSELFLLKNLIIIHNLNELDQKILELINNETPYEEDGFLNYFIAFDNESYSQKLTKLIINFINKNVN